MRPSRHLALSSAAGGAVWAATGEAWALPVTVATGVLVDADHTPDLWWAFALKLRPVAIVALHGWEWLAALIVLGVWTQFSWWLVAVIVGYGLHLVTDHLFNNGNLLSYSLIYRARHRFIKEKVSPRWDSERTHETLSQELPSALWLFRLVEETISPTK